MMTFRNALIGVSSAFTVAACDSDIERYDKYLDHRAEYEAEQAELTQELSEIPASRFLGKFTRGIRGFAQRDAFIDRRDISNAGDCLRIANGFRRDDEPLDQVYINGECRNDDGEVVAEISCQNQTRHNFHDSWECQVDL